MTFKKLKQPSISVVVASDLNFLAFAFEMLCCQCNAMVDRQGQNGNILV